MHRKRLTIPKSWPVPTKTHKWIYKTKPGPHRDGIPLGVFIRDFLHITELARETNAVLKSGKIEVDGKRRKEPGFPVGVMDVVSIPSINRHFRLAVSKEGVRPIEIDEKESSKKLVKVVNKTTLKGNKEQTTTHDGRNFLKSYPMQATLLISLPDQKVEKVMEMKEGALVSILSGKHKGELGKLISQDRSKQSLEIEIDKKKIEVPLKSAFVVGFNEPEVKIE